MELQLNEDGTFTYEQDGNMNSGDSFVYKAYDGNSTVIMQLLIFTLVVHPVRRVLWRAEITSIFTYTDPLCKKVRVYVPKGKAFSFRHLEGSIYYVGNYTLLSSVNCN